MNEKSNKFPKMDCIPEVSLTDEDENHSLDVIHSSKRCDKLLFDKLSEKQDLLKSDSDIYSINKAFSHNSNGKFNNSSVDNDLRCQSQENINTAISAANFSPLNTGTNNINARPVPKTYINNIKTKEINYLNKAQINSEVEALLNDNTRQYSQICFDVDNYQSITENHVEAQEKLSISIVETTDGKNSDEERETEDDYEKLCINHESSMKSNENCNSRTPTPEGYKSKKRGSYQWFQNTFNLGQKYKNFFGLRRPSDIVEDQIRTSNEELEKDSNSIVLTTHSGMRRNSDNQYEKPKRFLFSSRKVQLSDFLRNRVVDDGTSKEPEVEMASLEDTCPIFRRPLKIADENEVILDALRQAMRKCTMMDPSCRPSSGLLLDQLSKLL